MKTCLVFVGKERKFPTVDHPWYRSLFRSRQARLAQTTKFKADHGDADAQFCLGQGLEQGERTSANDVEAVAWYRRAASQNHAAAQFKLGLMLTDGRGATRDETEARHWIHQAALQGHAAAQHHLGVRHRRASFNGCTEDAAEFNLEAYKWFWLAAAQGHAGSAGELENLTLRMTREQVLESDQRVARHVEHAAAAGRVEESPGPGLKT